MVDIKATSPQLKAVEDMLEAYCSLELKNVLPLLAKNFKFETFPKIPEHPDETKDKHFAKYGKILALFTELETVVHEVIEEPEKGKVVTHVTFYITTADATKLEYDSVIVNTVVEEDGVYKILEGKDFSDPIKRKKVHDWVFRALGRAPGEP